jgi:hypothetical protein
VNIALLNWKNIDVIFSIFPFLSRCSRCGRIGLAGAKLLKCILTLQSNAERIRAWVKARLKEGHMLSINGPKNSEMQQFATICNIDSVGRLMHLHAVSGWDFLMRTPIPSQFQSAGKAAFVAPRVASLGSYY